MKELLGKHEKTIVAGACAAVLGMTGLTGYQLTDVRAEIIYRENQEALTSERLISESAASGSGYAASSSESADYGSGYADYGSECADSVAEDWSAGRETSIATESADVGNAYSEDAGLYTALGLTREKNGYWSYDGKQVKAVLIEDGSLTTWGNPDRDSSVCLYVTREADKHQVLLSIKEMNPDEFLETYNENHKDSLIF